MADENEVKALIARFWEVRQKLTAYTSETTFWAMVVREALRWRDETRPAQAPPAAVPADGWKEAAIAWEVCASIHRKYAKGRDALFSTRQQDFVAGAEKARAKLCLVAQAPSDHGQPDHD